MKWIKTLFASLVILIVFVFLSFSNANTVPPFLLSYTNQTTGNNTITNQSSIQSNITISGNWADSKLDSFVYRFDGISYRMYDPSLVLSLSFENNSAMGNKNATDISKYMHDATLINVGYNASGRYGSALQVPEGLCSEANTSDLGLYGSKNFTIMFWAKQNADSLPWQNILSFGSSSFRFEVGDPTSSWFISSSGISPEDIDLLTDIRNNEWVSIVFTSNSTTWEAYVNGALKNSGPTNGTFNGRKLTIGDLSAGNCWSWGGLIDEVRIYNRSMTSDEITKTYQSTITKKNQTEYNFYINVSGIGPGIHTFSSSAEDSLGDENTTGAYYATYRKACIIPTDGMILTEDTVLCGGEYYLPQGIVIGASNIILDGNKSTIFGNSSLNGITADSYDNLVLMNLTIANYSVGIHIATARNINVSNVTITKTYTNGLFTDTDTENVSIRNVVFKDIYDGYGSQTNGNNIIVDGNQYLNIPTMSGLDWTSGLLVKSPNQTITNNLIRTTDIGIYLTDNAHNVYVGNNTVDNSTVNSDIYSTGIFLFSGANNVTITGNVITDAGQVGILLMNASNVSIRNNYIDNVNPVNLNKTRTSSPNEPFAGISLNEVYTSFTTDASELDSDNISEITKYHSTNVNIANNSYGPNVQLLLRSQGTVNLTHDLSAANYWYRKLQYPTTMVDPDEFYVSVNYTGLNNWNGHQMNDVLLQGYAVYDFSKYWWQYRVNRSYLSFRNINMTSASDVSIYYPHTVAFNITNKVTKEAVNFALPASSNWYNTTGMDISPQNGSVVGVRVTQYNSSSVSWNENSTGYIAINRSICGMLTGQTYFLRIDSTGYGTYVADGSSCVLINTNLSYLSHVFSLQHSATGTTTTTSINSTTTSINSTTTTTSTSSTTTTSTTTSTSSTTTTTSINSTTTTTQAAKICSNPSNKPPCNVVTLQEVIDCIYSWTQNKATLDDVISMINQWIQE